MALIYNQAWNIKNYRYVGDVSQTQPKFGLEMGPRGHECGKKHKFVAALGLALSTHEHKRTDTDILSRPIGDALNTRNSAIAGEQQ